MFSTCSSPGFLWETTAILVHVARLYITETRESFISTRHSSAVPSCIVCLSNVRKARNSAEGQQLTAIQHRVTCQQYSIMYVMTRIRLYAYILSCPVLATNIFVPRIHTLERQKWRIAVHSLGNRDTAVVYFTKYYFISHENVTSKPKSKFIV